MSQVPETRQRLRREDLSGTSLRAAVDKYAESPTEHRELTKIVDLLEKSGRIPMTTPVKSPMEFPQILQQVTRLLGGFLDMAPARINPSDSITETLKMDPISVAGFAVALEIHFSTKNTDEALEGAKTVEDIARRVEEMLLAQGRVADHVVKPPIDPNAIGLTDNDPEHPSLCKTCGAPEPCRYGSLYFALQDLWSA